MWTRAIIAAALLSLTCATGAEARTRRVVHIYADTIVLHPRVDTSLVSLPGDSIVVHGKVRRPKAERSTRASLIACQMGSGFLGEAWRGKRYRPFTRTGRPRICMTG